LVCDEVALSQAVAKARPHTLAAPMLRELAALKFD